MELDNRLRGILCAICEQYIRTGEPLGSRRLRQLRKLPQSATSVRQLMATLEEQGLIGKPHASAGRIPTDRGLRFFVDHLMKTADLGPAERDGFAPGHTMREGDSRARLREVSRLLSIISQQCSLGLVAGSPRVTLRKVEFLPVGSRRLLVILVMGSGVVRTHSLNVERDYNSWELAGIHRYLNELCAGRGLREVRALVGNELRREESFYDRLRASALRLGSEALAGAHDDELVVEGQAHLLSRTSGPLQVRALLEAIEKRCTVLRLLDKTVDADGVQVYIGRETEEAALGDCAVVVAPYGGRARLGTVGVIGSLRLDYARLMPLVDYAARVLTAEFGQ